MSNTGNTAKPLLFINSDPNDHGTVPHRRAVYQHVQLKYVKWKRGKEVRKRLTSTSESAASQSSVDHSVSASSSPYSTTNTDHSTNLDLPFETVRSPPPGAAESHTIAQYHATPSPILQHGNSDPFSALAVNVSPQVNALMQYTRDCYLPGIQNDITNPGLKTVGPEWEQCISYLQDKGLAFSHLARVATILASDPKQSALSQELRTQALVFRSKSLTTLRKKLEESPQDPKTYNQILLLMNTDTFDRNFSAASSHAGMLVSLLQNGVIQCDLAFLFKVLYHDHQRAAMSLTRPMFDLNTWVPAQYAPIHDLVVARLPPMVQLEAVAEDLDSILDDYTGLKYTLTIFKHACLALMIVLTDKRYGEDIQIIFHGRFTMTLVMGRLINHYLDAAGVLDEYKRRQKGLEDQAIARAYVEAYLSLASALLLRCMTRIDCVKISGDIVLFDANALIVEQLKDILDIESRHLAKATQRRSTNARLYALFIGAWLEQAKEAALTGIAGSQSDYGARGGWFNLAFATQARSMGLYEWPDVRKILLGFVYTDMLQPNGIHWFPSIMNAVKSHQLIPLPLGENAYGS